MIVFRDDLIKCNICGKDADFQVEMELVWDRSDYYRLANAKVCLFYLCKTHEYLYDRMQHNVELTQYFNETKELNR